VRIVLLNQYFAPDEAATAQLLADLGEGLAAAGHEVVAVCSRRAYESPELRYPSRETVRGVTVRRVKTTGFGRATATGRSVDYLTFLLGAALALLFRRRPDVVVSLSTPPLVAFVGLALARLRGARSVYWVMDVYPELAFRLGVLREGSLGGRMFARISRATLRGSDVVVALGESMAAQLASRGGSNVAMIHNWADGEAIRPRSVQDHPLREAWGWTGSFVLLYSGNMGLAHEFETLLDAAERLKERPEIRFAFVGGGPRREEVEREARRRGLTNVEFRPYVAREDLGRSLTAGDLHLVTLRDGLPGLLVPSKIYGILAAGRPTLYVGPGEGEVADIIASGRCGTRVAAGDSSGLARAIERYAGDAALREEQGRRARELFDRRFARPRAMQAFLDLIAPRGEGGSGIREAGGAGGPGVEPWQSS
jgi:glycosyltransferase involved in cell wall biosynthesis